MTADAITGAPPTKIAKFEDLVIGMKVRTGDVGLTVFEKDSLRVTLRLHVPLRSPVSVCVFHAESALNSSGSSIVSR